jgi:hypothetical protein
MVLGCLIGDMVKGNALDLSGSLARILVVLPEFSGR